MCVLRAMLLVYVAHVAAAEDFAGLKRIRECLAVRDAVVCLKEGAIDALSAAAASDKPISLYGVVDIVRDPGYTPREHARLLSTDRQARSIALSSILYDKFMDLLGSRSVNVKLSPLFEGRKKKNRNGIWILAALAMAGMLTQMFMGKIAVIAGTALLLSKLAMVVSTVVGLKKLTSGGGDTSRVIYTDGGHGGWHRSIAGQDAEAGPYRAYTSQGVPDSYTY